MNKLIIIIIVSILIYYFYKKINLILCRNVQRNGQSMVIKLKDKKTGLYLEITPNGRILSPDDDSNIYQYWELSNSKVTNMSNFMLISIFMLRMISKGRSFSPSKGLQYLYACQDEANKIYKLQQGNTLIGISKMCCDYVNPCFMTEIPQNPIEVEIIQKDLTTYAHAIYNALYSEQEAKILIKEYSL